MHFKLMLFLMIAALSASADDTEKVLNDYDPKVDIVSENYENGPFLIYDCIEKHYTCVLESYFNDCQKKRDEDLHFKKLELSCAPITQLPNKKSCFQKQLFMVSQNHGVRFCVGPDWKQKEINLSE